MIDVRNSTLGVWVSAREVLISRAAIEGLAFCFLEMVEERIQNAAQDSVDLTEQFLQGLTRLEKAQLLLLADLLNFSFYPEPNQEKWCFVDAGGRRVSGSFGVLSALRKAHNQGLPILSADYLAKIDQGVVAEIFASSKDPLPMLAERVSILKESGQVLKESLAGQFINLVDQSRGQALGLLTDLVSVFPAFRDEARYRDVLDVGFYKKAQLLVVDLVRAGVAEFSNLDRLTCLADYRLPRVLRHLGILEYEEELAQKVDGGQELKAGSSAEIEIRAATIWAVELLRVRLEPVRTAPELDQKLYLLDKVLERKLGDKYPPHHQVRTIFY